MPTLTYDTVNGYHCAEHGKGYCEHWKMIGRSKAARKKEVMDAKIPPWIETAIGAAVCEIQRRNRVRNFVLIAPNGDRAPVMTTEEMLHILREFIASAQEGLG